MGDRYFTEDAGAVVAYHVYYPFGEEATAFNQDAEQMKFTGHERDLGSAAGAGDDLDYMHARHASPLTGRFLSVDPKLNAQAARSNPQRWNRYSYAVNKPLKLFDPDGKEALVFIVGPGSNMFEWFGHAAIYVRSGGESRGVSNGPRDSRILWYPWGVMENWMCRQSRNITPLHRKVLTACPTGILSS